MASPIRYLLATLACVVVTFGFAAAEPKVAPGQHVTIHQEIELGNEVSARVRKQLGGAWNNPQQLERVKRIAFRLFGVSDRHDNAQLRENFTVELVDTKMVNAMCVPGGHTFVTRGLIELNLSDDELACVMGHEIAHAARRHGARNLEAAAGLEGRINQTTNIDILRKFGKATILIYLFKRFDPQLEYEADYYGEIYAARAGYNPNGMVALFERFEKLEGRSGDDSITARLKRRLLSLFDNHPPTPQRLARAREEAGRLQHGENLPTTPVPIYE